MQYFAFRTLMTAGIAGVLVCFSCALLVHSAAGADIEIESVMGEPVVFHGFSYVGDSVYLFLTGPGLPVNGVTLTDISQRADQGHFTVVEVDRNQEWTYTWKTSRIDSEIDDGTYVVYVTNEPRDLSQLGDERRYKTISVFLKDSGVSKVSISAQHVYTRNPEDLASTPTPVPLMNTTLVTPTVTLPLALETVTGTPDQPTVPMTQADTGPSIAVIALMCCGYLVSLQKDRH